MTDEHSSTHAENQPSWPQPSPETQQHYYQPPPEPPGPSAPASRSSNRRLFIILAVVGLLVAGGAAAAIVSASGGSGTKQIAVNGSVTVTDTTGDSISSSGGDGAECSGSGGYSDLAQGAEVVIADDTGKTLTITQLGAGKNELTSCIFTFTANVPAGKKFYGVTVTHRGTVKLNEAEIKAPALSIGS